MTIAQKKYELRRKDSGRHVEYTRASSFKKAREYFNQYYSGRYIIEDVSNTDKDNYISVRL